MANLLAFIPTGTSGDQERVRRAYDIYAASRSWPKLQSENFIHASGTVNGLGSAVETLTGGDVLLLPSLADVSERPSVQEQTILGLIGRGVRIHIMSLHGDVDPHMLSLMEAWRSVAPIERKVDEISREMESMAALQAEENALFETEVVKKLADKFGVGGLTKAPEPKPGEPNQIGDFIRRQREARGLSQKQLAAKLGISKSQFNRVELFGEGGKSLETILEFFAQPQPQPQPQEKSQ